MTADESKVFAKTIKMEVDEQGLREVAEAQERLMRRALELEKKSEERSASSGEALVPYTVAMLRVERS